MPKTTTTTRTAPDGAALVTPGLSEPPARAGKANTQTSAQMRLKQSNFFTWIPPERRTGGRDV